MRPGSPSPPSLFSFRFAFSRGLATPFFCFFDTHDFFHFSTTFFLPLKKLPPPSRNNSCHYHFLTLSATIYCSSHSHASHAGWRFDLVFFDGGEIFYFRGGEKERDHEREREEFIFKKKRKEKNSARLLARDFARALPRASALPRKTKLLSPARAYI